MPGCMLSVPPGTCPRTPTPPTPGVVLSILPGTPRAETCAPAWPARASAATTTIVRPPVRRTRRRRSTIMETSATAGANSATCIFPLLLPGHAQLSRVHARSLGARRHAARPDPTGHRRSSTSAGRLPGGGGAARRRSAIRGASSPRSGRSARRPQPAARSPSRHLLHDGSSARYGSNGRCGDGASVARRSDGASRCGSGALSASLGGGTHTCRRSQ